MRNEATTPQHEAIRVVFSRLLIVAVLLVSTVVTTRLIDGITPTVSAFQSPLPERHRESKAPNIPPEWVYSGEGGVRVFGPVQVTLPRGFTEQGGATVIGNMIVIPVGIEDTASMIPGTEFALGIWPPNDQIEYLKPVEIRMMLNAAQISSEAEEVTLVRYDPAIERWVPMDTEFNRATYQLTTRLQEFSPVPRDFTDWGGRTFFAAARIIAADDTPEATEATIIRNANIRSGPGITYAVLRVARAGEVISPVYKSADGRWLQLENGTWVAAFLVDNAPDVPVVPTAMPTRVPNP